MSLKELLARIINALKVDYIVEQGTNGIWTYRKWNSGIAECWGALNGSANFTRSWAGMSICDSMNVSFPADLFIATPFVTFSNSGGGSAVVFNGGSATQYQVPIQLGRGSNGSAVTFNVPIVAKGRWK